MIGFWDYSIIVSKPVYTFLTLNYHFIYAYLFKYKIIYIENCKVGTNGYFAVDGTGHGTGSSNRDNPVQNGTSGHPTLELGQIIIIFNLTKN